MSECLLIKAILTVGIQISTRFPSDNKSLVEMDDGNKRFAALANQA